MQIVDVQLKDLSGNILFERKGVEAPRSWSKQAIDIAAAKFFTKDETSVFDMVRRVAHTLVEKAPWLNEFHPDFENELYDILINQRASFNSPVWFNLGVFDDPMLCACYILKLEDSMDSILDINTQSGNIFKYGGGTGVNYSRIRAKDESLSCGGKASGPLSFMKGHDAFAGIIKSGGKTRRAARMAMLDIDHPDVEEFIECKSIEEEKIRLLNTNPKWYNPNNPLESESVQTVAYQNGNNSVRVSDAFMKAVETDADWNLIGRVTGKPVKTVKARALFRKIAENAWKTGDPGVQFDDTINKHNPLIHKERINASNPCLAGTARLITRNGFTPIESLNGQEIEILHSSGLFTKAKVFSSGRKKTIKVKLSNGVEIECTPDHLWRVKKDNTLIDMQAGDLTCGTEVNTWDGYNNGFVTVKNIKAGSLRKQVYDFTILDPNYEPYAVVDGVVLHNCSEFMFIDESACNLSSLTLWRYWDGKEFNYDLFAHDIHIMIVAMDAVCALAKYPSEHIRDNSWMYRPLGLGYAGLGSLLMRRGLAYGSDHAVNLTEKITKFMTIEAWKASEMLYKHLGCHMSEEDQKGVRDLVQRNYGLDIVGARNAQVTLLAPTGTIGLQMDSDTQGIEPFVTLIAHKQLVGGGMLVQFAEAATCCLEKLGYNVSEALDYAKKNQTLRGFVRDMDLPIFATAIGDNTISPEDHLRIMTAAQQHISGAISKTVNLPQSATVEDIENLYIDAWKRGLKALALYRDNSKAFQPISDGKTTPQTSSGIKKKKLPPTRKSITHKIELLNGIEAYLTVSQYDDGTPGELFLNLSTGGSTLAGMADMWAIAISMGLQYGIPVDKFVEKFMGRTFEPGGYTTNAEIQTCTSLVDYIARFLSKTYAVEPEGKIEYSGTRCSNCGSDKMMRNGTCHVCQNCGTTTGCG